MRQSTYTLNIEFLTPVFIGTGQELDPLSYVAGMNNGAGSCLHLIDLEQWASDNADDAKLQEVFNEASYTKLRRYVAQNISLETYTREIIPVRSQAFVKMYEQALKGGREEHRLLVEPTHRTSAGLRPYIPGSSLKGAIRTAVAASHEKQAGRPKTDKFRRPDWREFNQRIFGKIGEDIFKYLKISDAPLQQGQTQLVRPIEVSKNPERNKATPKNFAEATQSLTLGQDLKAFTKLIIRHPPKQEQSARRIVHPFSLLELFGWLNKFYYPKYFRELNDFYRQPHLQKVDEHLKEVTEKIQNTMGQGDNTYALLRLGHYSHIECVTLDIYSSPYFKKGYGKTRTLAEGLVPFGWVLLTADEGYKAETDGSSVAVSVSQAKEDAHEKVESSEPHRSREEELAQKLEHFKLELTAIPLNKLPGTLPGLAERIIKHEDQEFAVQAAKSMLDYIRETKMTKKLKQKKWYHNLTVLTDV